MEVLNRSAINLQEFFTATWGTVYSQNSHVFSDLYKDLRHYYRGSHINLEEVLNEFWAKLLEKLFTQANKPSFIGTANERCNHAQALCILTHKSLMFQWPDLDLIKGHCPVYVENTEVEHYLQVRTTWSACQSRLTPCGHSEKSPAR